MRGNIMARRALSAVASALFCAFAMGAMASEDATAFQINPAHSGGVNFVAGFSAPLIKLWTYDTGGSVSYPLIAGNRLFVVSGGNDVFALNLADGHKVWEHLLGGSYNYGAYDGGSLFFQNSDGQIAALKAKTGRQLWSANAASDFSLTDPIATGGTVYIGGPALTAISEATGAVLWAKGIEATDSEVAYGNRGLYVGGPDQYYRFGTDGSLTWHVSGCCSGGGGIQVAYFDKRAYLVDWAAGNFVLSAADGSSAGSFPGSTPPSFFSVGKRSYELVIANGKLYCLDVKTGNVVWSFANNGLSGQPIVINNQPVVAAGSSVYMLDGSTGAQLWTDDVGSQISNLNAGDGALAVTADSKVVVYVPQ